MGRSDHSPAPPKSEPAEDDRVTALRTDADNLRRELDLVRHASRDGIASLRKKSDEWSRQASRAVATSLAEAENLRVKLAAESAMRLKLLNELQDIRGTVRVYCRPRPATIGPSGGRGILSTPAHDVLVVNVDGTLDSACPPASFRYDRVFPPGAGQNEVFAELEESLISSLDGFNVTLLAFGQQGAGKTHSLIGGGGPRVSEDGGDAHSLESGGGQRHHHGVQMQAIQQLFTIAGHRADRYRDALSMTIVEVHNEKLVDLVAGTTAGDERGEPIVCETRDGRGRERNSKRGGNESSSAAGDAKGRLEIRTNIDGNTVVQGLNSVPIESFEDACEIWREAVSRRADRVRRQGEDVARYESRSSVITTVSITSVNVATGVGTEGRLQFVDMASSDLSSTPSGSAASASDLAPEDENDNVKFASRSISALNDVVNARCQFDRSVPYRNSTLTHLLRDSLEADTKVLLLCCVSPDEADAKHTVGALKFASRMQKVSIGKATKHCSGSKE